MTSVVVLGATVLGLLLTGGGDRAWLVPLLGVVAGVSVGAIDGGHVREALDGLAEPLAFLALAVPLAIELDRSGFFGSVAARFVGAERTRLHAGCWWFAAAVVVVFNLDAAVVLLTPLYLRIARERGEPALPLCLAPALLASLASSALPVSNLTNLVAAERFDLGSGPFLRHLLAPTLAATFVGWLCMSRSVARTAPSTVRPRPAAGPRPSEGLVVGGLVTAWLLAGFVGGAELGVPAWAVVIPPLAVLAVRHRRFPWRTVPVDAVVIALGLGTVTLAAAPHLGLGRVLGDGGPVGDAVAFGVAALCADVMNNLPALLAFLGPLEQAPDSLWPVLLGVNLGPTLWVFGALSTLLWRSTMRRLGEPVSVRTYVRSGWAIGGPASLAGLAVLVVLG